VVKGIYFIINKKKKKCKPSLHTTSDQLFQFFQDKNKMSTSPTLSRHTVTTTMLKLLPKITEQTKTLTLMVDSDLLETMEISKLDSKISTLNQMSMDTDSPKLEIKSQITEMETGSELELQLIPPIIPLEEELLLLTED
jgi:hypothetical protein